MKKILIVEDDRDISLALTVRLKFAGFDVSIAPDAVHGMMKAVKERPELIILDISMPGGSGLDIAKRVRQNPDIIDVPIIFITANYDSAIQKEAELLDATGFFHKPYDADELLRTVQKAIA